MNKKEETFFTVLMAWAGRGEPSQDRRRQLHGQPHPPRPRDTALLPPGMSPQMEPTGSQGVGRAPCWGPWWAWR